MEMQRAATCDDTKISRRSLIKGSVAVAGGAAAGVAPVGCSRPALSAVGAGAAPTLVIASDSNAVVETQYGKVRGYTSNGIHTFRGVPYGASTAGKARFMPPAKPEAWKGVRSCLWYGPTCPQIPRAGWANDENAFLFQWDDGQPGEDCLRLNIWTPGLNDGRKRPVMVWLHGGGFTAGSGQEQPAYHGESLSRRGDVVVVTLNHRLGILGFLNLAEYGSKYADSANVGMLDLIAALEWVRDNIAQFGGNPGNVTIFGQSGGGAKVSTLMAMPGANGLFHKAIVQSGSGLRMVPPPESAKLAAAVLSELGLGKSQVDKLQDLPVNQLIAGMIAAGKRVAPAAPPPPGLIGPRTGWGPTVDGKHLPQDPFHPAAPAQSKNVPMIIGTVLNESSPSMFNAELENMSEPQLLDELAKRFGNRAGAILEVARRVYPNARPVELSGLIARPRINAVLQATRKYEQAAAPVYTYLFCWKTPVLDGRPRAFHCAEIPFVFYNTDRSAFATGGTEEARALSAKVSDAWIHFARRGDPNHPGLPQWPAFEPQRGPTMIFDNVCEVKSDPDRELREVLQES